MRVYRLIFPNGKSYVGQTVVSLRTRWRQHVGYARRGSLVPVARAIAKYGAENITVEELYYGGRLTEMEQKCIKFFNTLVPNGYNLTAGGETGTKLEIVKRKQSVALKRYIQEHPDSRKNFSAQMRSRWADPEWRARTISAQKKGRSEGGQALRIQRIKAAWVKRKERGWTMPLEARERMAKKCRGIKRSPEFRARVSDNMRQRWQDPAYRERLLQKRRAALQRKQASMIGVAPSH